MKSKLTSNYLGFEFIQIGKNILFLFLLLSSFITIAQRSYLVKAENSFFNVYQDDKFKIIYSSGDAVRSIQWAINNIDEESSVGGDILMDVGEYPLNNFLFLKSNIWLHGKGELTKLILDASLRTCITLQDVNYVTLSDFSLIRKTAEGREGITIERSVSCKIMKMNISGFDTGIVNDDESALTLITENKLENNKLHIHIKSGGGVMGKWIPGFISNNTIQGGEMGIHCNAMVTNILHNKISNLSGRGIFASTNSIVVRGNEIRNVGGDFAIYGTGAEFNCTDNIIMNVNGGGIRTTTRWGNFTNNRIMNCGTMENPAIGILVVSENTHEGPAESKVIFQNTIVNEPDYPPLLYGIKEAGVTNVISNNFIQNFQIEGILSEGKNTIVTNNVLKK